MGEKVVFEFSNGFFTPDQRMERVMKDRISSGKARLIAFFDADTFVELGAYIRRPESEDAEGVICGYGACGGRLVFALHGARRNILRLVGRLQLSVRAADIQLRLRGANQ